MTSLWRPVTAGARVTNGHRTDGQVANPRAPTPPPPPSPEPAAAPPRPGSRSRPRRCPVVERGVEQVAGRRLDPPGDRRDAEEHRAQQVERGDSPAHVVRSPREPRCARPRRRPARWRPGSRSTRRRPASSTTRSAFFGVRFWSRAVNVVTLKAQRTDQLDERRPPVDPPHLDRDQAAPGRHVPADVERCADALHELEVGGRREEDRADEVGHSVRQLADHG